MNTTSIAANLKETISEVLAIVHFIKSGDCERLTQP
jgi:hypothetical protein